MSKERQYNIAGLNVVHGMSWIPLISSENELEELDSLINQYEAGLLIRLQGETKESEPIYGFASKEFVKSKRPKAKELYSIAVLLAELCRSGTCDANSIFLFKVPQQINKKEPNSEDDDFDDNLVLMVAIENGFPASGGELFDTEEEIDKIIKDTWLSSGTSYSIYTSGTDLFDDSSREFDLEGIFANFSVEQKLKAKLNKPKFKLSPKAVLAILGFVALTGLMFYEDIKNYFAPPPPPPKTVDYVKNYFKGLKDTFAKAGHPGGKQIHQLNKIMRAIPLNLGGWRLLKVQCDFLSCKTEYVPKELLPSNNATFLTAFETYVNDGRVSNITFELNGKKIKFNWGSKQDFAFESNLVLDEAKLPTMSLFQAEVYPTYQNLNRLGLAYKFDKTKPLGVTGVPFAKVPKDIMVNNGKFTLKGYAWQLNEIPIAGNMVVKEVIINMGKEITSKNLFTLKGNYYVK